MESKRNETFAMIFLGTNAIQETGSGRLEAAEEATRVAGTLWGGAPASWAPRCSSGVLLPPIYTHVP